jgi:hypothetical protein
MSAGGAAGGAAAAAAAAAAMRQEEEEMTPYAPSDLAGDWEFKILRSQTGTFKNPERLRAVLEEEARAGWTLVEKFDNSRVRLKRPASARQLDGKLDFDPYRTNVGISEGGRVLLILGIVFGLILSLALFVAIVKR